MIETSLSSWFGFAMLLLLASGAGLGVASAMPWSGRALERRIPLAAGVALGPFLAGLCAVAALGLLPGLPPRVHLVLVLAGLGAMMVLRRRAIGALVNHPAGSEPRPGVWTVVFGGIVLAWAIGLLVDTLFMPLTQNDALEYATVGRLLFETRDLATYPVLDPKTSSGFYGPWTHPPLYVALIYLCNAAQGHADHPGLLRLVAPWFTLSAVWLVGATGRLHSTVTGIGAALIFLGTPLLYLGAGSALIDALPVSGMALLLCTIVCLHGGTWRAGASQGLVLGLALWTHSQAILFLPLGLAAMAAQHGPRDLRRLLVQAASAITAALLVAFWPYLRNVFLYGSPISDNPAVFAMPQLQWPVYFQMARGYESWGEKIQYGVFKGWMMPEAYAAGFWLALPGIWLFLRQVGFGRVFWTAAPDTQDLSVQWLRAIFCILACYLAGVILSVCIGVDLMIRNERYQLVMVPCVAWFGGVFLASVMSHSEGRSGPAVFGLVRKGLATAFCMGLTLLCLQQLLVVGSYKFRTYGITLDTFTASPAEKLQRYPAYAAVDYLARQTPPDAVVLSMKPADMYYAQRRMISYLDPRMIPVYAEPDPARMRQKLLAMGIRYLHVADYSLPPMYRSAIEPMMARPDLADLVHSLGGHQIYDLSSTGGQRAGGAADISPRAREWISRRSAVLGGRVGLVHVPLSEQPLDSGMISKAPNELPFFRREFTTLLMTGRGMSRELDRSLPIPVGGGREYLLEIELEGHAYPSIYLIQFDEQGRALGLPQRDGVAEPVEGKPSWGFISRQRLGDMAVPAVNGPARFARRFLTYPHARSIGVIVEHRGATFLRLLAVSLREVVDSAETNDERRH